MKKSIYKLLIISLIISVKITNSYGQELVKRVNKEFVITSDNTLDIQAKFGNVNITTSNSDKLKIDIIISTDSDSRKAVKIFKSIDISVQKNDDVIYIKTDLPNAKNISNHLTIKYEISAPKFTNINLKESFGNCYIGDIDGKINMNLKFGNFQAEKLLNKTNVFTFKYVDKATIEQLSQARITSGFSEIVIEKASILNIKSSYSNYDINKIYNLIADTRFDEFNINKVTNLKINSQYTSFDIENLIRKLKIYGKFGSININLIPKGFKEINVETQFTDIELGIDPQASYSIYALTKFADIDYNESRFKGSTYSKSSSIKLDGTIGDKSNKSTVHITSSFGDVEL